MTRNRPYLEHGYVTWLTTTETVELEKLIMKSYIGGACDVKPRQVKSTNTNTVALKSSPRSGPTPHREEEDVPTFHRNTGKDKIPPQRKQENVEIKTTKIKRDAKIFLNFSKAKSKNRLKIKMAKSKFRHKLKLVKINYHQKQYVTKYRLKWPKQKTRERLSPSRMPRSVYSKTPAKSVSSTSETVKFQSLSVDQQTRCTYTMCLRQKGRASLRLEGFYQTEWLDAILAIGEPFLQGLTNQRFIIVGTFLLLVRIEDACVRVVFGEVRNLAVPVLLGAPFINKFVKGNFPPEHKIVL